MARNYRIPCPVLAGSGVCDQRLDAELPAMESTWQPLVSLPAGWEQLCSTQTPPGSALPLAPCLPHTSPSASSCPQQDQDPRTPLQEPPEGHGGPPLARCAFPPKKKRSGFIFTARGLGVWPLGPSPAPAQPRAPVLPLQKHADNNRKEAERERKSETTDLPPCSCTEQSPNEKNMAAS